MFWPKGSKSNQIRSEHGMYVFLDQHAVSWIGHAGN